MADASACLATDDLVLRPWTRADAPALARLGDGRDSWINRRDRFPRTLTLPAADLWLAEQMMFEDEQRKRTSFAIEWREELAGGISLTRRDDVHRICADLSVWMGRPYCGRGIATASVSLVTGYGFDTLGLERVQALVFYWNPESSRVMQNARFTLEGRLRRYVLKDGRVGDAFVYARLRNDP